MHSNSLDFQNLMQGFRLSCQTEGKSPKTVEWYIGFLNTFLRFLNDRSRAAEIRCIGKEQVREFIHYLQTEAMNPRNGKTLSPATVQGYVRTLKAFFSWLTREGYIEANPVSQIPVPKASIKIINAFTQEQVGRLAVECQAGNGGGQRDLAIIILMLDTGLRVSEVVGIGLGDVNLKEGYIKVRQAKGDKERLVPIGSVAQRSLWKYINHYRAKPITNNIGNLFINENGLPLTKSGIQQMVRRCGKRAGITGVRCSPHTFRHTFAKNYLLNGGDIFSLQKILGHSSLASVRMYLNLFAMDIKKQHQRFSPVDNMAESRSLYPLVRCNNHDRNK